MPSWNSPRRHVLILRCSLDENVSGFLRSQEPVQETHFKIHCLPPLRTLIISETEIKKKVTMSEFHLLALKSKGLLLGIKAIANLDNILKIRDIILLTKVRIVKAMIFPVVMYGCESWTIKKG